MPLIKICGITNVKDAVAAYQSGADGIGFNFYKKSKRYITKETAKEIVKALPKTNPKFKTIGFFVNEEIETITEIVNFTDIDMLEMHEEDVTEFCEEAGGPVIKAIRVKDKSFLKTMVDFHIHYKLLRISEKKIFNFRLATEASNFGMVILAGGVNKDNILDAINKVKPYCVDVCKEVEVKTGKVDHNKMKEIIKLVHRT